MPEDPDPDPDRVQTASSRIQQVRERERLVDEGVPEEEIRTRDTLDGTEVEVTDDGIRHRAAGEIGVDEDDVVITETDDGREVEVTDDVIRHRAADEIGVDEDDVVITETDDGRDIEITPEGRLDLLEDEVGEGHVLPSAAVSMAEGIERRIGSDPDWEVTNIHRDVADESFSTLRDDPADYILSIDTDEFEDDHEAWRLTGFSSVRGIEQTQEEIREYQDLREDDPEGLLDDLEGHMDDIGRLEERLEVLGQRAVADREAGEQAREEVADDLGVDPGEVDIDIRVGHSDSVRVGGLTEAGEMQAAEAQRDDIADDISDDVDVGVEPEDIEFDRVDGEIQAGVGRDVREDIAIEQAVDEGDFGRDDIAGVDLEAGEVEFTDGFLEDRAIDEIVEEEEELDEDDIADIDIGDDGEVEIQPTDEWREEMALEQVVDEDGELGRDDIADIDIDGGEVDIQPTDEWREEQALEQIVDEDGELGRDDIADIDIGDDEIEIQPTDEWREEQALEQAFEDDEFTGQLEDLGVDEDDLTVDDGQIQLDDDVQRDLVAEQLEEEFPRAEVQQVEVDNGDVDAVLEHDVSGEEFRLSEFEDVSGEVDIDFVEDEEWGTQRVTVEDFDPADVPEPALAGVGETVDTIADDPIGESQAALETGAGTVSTEIETGIEGIQTEAAATRAEIEDVIDDPVDWAVEGGGDAVEGIEGQVDATTDEIEDALEERPEIALGASVAAVPEPTPATEAIGVSIAGGGAAAYVLSREDGEVSVPEDGVAIGAPEIAVPETPAAATRPEIETPARAEPRQPEIEAERQDVTEVPVPETPEVGAPEIDVPDDGFEPFDVGDGFGIATAPAAEVVVEEEIERDVPPEELPADPTAPTPEGRAPPREAFPSDDAYQVALQRHEERIVQEAVDSAPVTVPADADAVEQVRAMRDEFGTWDEYQRELQEAREEQQAAQTRPEEAFWSPEGVAEQPGAGVDATLERDERPQEFDAVGEPLPGQQDRPVGIAEPVESGAGGRAEWFGPVEAPTETSDADEAFGPITDPGMEREAFDPLMEATADAAPGTEMGVETAIETTTELRTEMGLAQPQLETTGLFDMAQPTETALETGFGEPTLTPTRPTQPGRSAPGLPRPPLPAMDGTDDVDPFEIDVDDEVFETGIAAGADVWESDDELEEWWGDDGDGFLSGVEDLFGGDGNGDNRSS